MKHQKGGHRHTCILPTRSDIELANLRQTSLADPDHKRGVLLRWSNKEQTVVNDPELEGVRKELDLHVNYLDFELHDVAETERTIFFDQMSSLNLDASQRAITWAQHPRFAHGGDRKSDDQEANLIVDQLAEKADVSARPVGRTHVANRRYLVPARAKCSFHERVAAVLSPANAAAPGCRSSQPAKS